jgi:hypothetical protein
MLEGTESLQLGVKFEMVPKHWPVASRTGWMFRRFSATLWSSAEKGEIGSGRNATWMKISRSWQSVVREAFSDQAEERLIFLHELSELKSNRVARVP